MSDRREASTSCLPCCSPRLLKRWDKRVGRLEIAGESGKRSSSACGFAETSCGVRKRRGTPKSTRLRWCPVTSRTIRANALLGIADVSMKAESAEQARGRAPLAAAIRDLHSLVQENPGTAVYRQSLSRAFGRQSLLRCRPRETRRTRPSGSIARRRARALPERCGLEARERADSRRDWPGSVGFRRPRRRNSVLGEGDRGANGGSSWGGWSIAGDRRAEARSRGASEGPRQVSQPISRCTRCNPARCKRGGNYTWN